MSQAHVAFQGRNPDVLTCIANLSNDEVFTPPELANEILDSVQRVWADTNGGSNIWADKTVRFLDPFTKSGVFLREITKRLVDGLATEIPDLDDRVDHILTKQVYGIAITELTSLLARRSLYCSKWANGKNSIAKSLPDPEGNVWFERTDHSWVNGRCKFCNAAEGEYGRSGDLESHAYAFIHADDISARLRELFGGDMKFDVVVGNPPYQLGSDGGTRDVPIYQNFVEQAKKLEPRLLSMIIPARWMAGGLGLAEFRQTMLSDRRTRSLVDYPVAKEVFSSVEIKGGVCYFLWDAAYNGDCEVTVVRGDSSVGPVRRKLDEYDVFIRDARALSILKRVLAADEPSLAEAMSSRTAFGLYSNYSKYREKAQKGDVRFYATSPKGRFTAWVSPEEVTNNHGAIDSYKAMIPKAGSDGGQKLPDVVLGKPWVAERPSVCTQSFLFVATQTKGEAESVASYYRTRFLRFLVSLRKIAQDTTASSYSWVPQQAWDHRWEDADLYEKYGITKDQIAYIESVVKPMDEPDE